MTRPDWNNLARHLRQAGWNQHARNLRLRIAEHGVGCAVTHAGRTLRFAVRDGLATALLIQGRERAVVATSDRWHLHIDAAPKSKPEATERMQRYAMHLPPALVQRADRLAAAQGKTRASLVRRAVELYLEGRRA